MMWDTWRAYVAIMCVQFIQPIASGVLLAVMKPAKERLRRLVKATAIGVVVAVMTSILGLVIYQHYPRPQYWSSGNLLLEAYFVFPVFPVVSGVAGGIICGAFDWRNFIRAQSKPRDTHIDLRP